MPDSITAPGSLLERLRRVRSLSRNLPRESPSNAADIPTETFFLGLDESPDPGLDTTPHDQHCLPANLSTSNSIIGPYHLLTVIGRGGMGIVFKARDTRLHRDVALKMLLSGAANDDRIASRFTIESQALARLDHQNVVPVFDVNEWEGLPYFVMKYVPGGTLAHAADRLRKDVNGLVAILARVCRAVGYLHEKNVSHRDLKPLNILLGDGDDPLVADFGLAKLHDADSGLTVTNCLLGTRAYMPPEQTQGPPAPLTPPGDIWSLGVIVYEMISGRLPFQANHQPELFGLINHADPANLTLPDGTVDKSLNAVVRKALAKDPKQRYATATELAEDLERWLAGQPVLATLPRRKTVWRWPAVAAAVVATLAFAWAVMADGSPVPATILIPIRGGPQVAVDALVNSPPKTGRDAGDRFTLDAADTEFLDFGSYTYPGGTLIEGDVQQLETPGHFAFAGIYCCGQIDTPGPAGRRLRAAFLRIDSIEHAGTTDAVSAKTGYGTLEVGRWNPNEAAPAAVWNTKAIGDSLNISRARMLPGIAASVHHLRIEISAEGTITGSINGSPITPATPRILDTHLATVMKYDRNPLPPAGSAAGHHVGLMVEHCKAAFWNVVVRPLNP